MDDWVYNDNKVNLLVDDILATFVDQDAPEVACEAMNHVFRPFMQWLHSAHRLKEDPRQVRATLLALTSSFIMETSKRMGEVDERGKRVPMEVWLGEFMLDLRDELVKDMNFLQARMGH